MRQARDASRCSEMSFPVFSKRHFPLKRQGKLGIQQSILNRYVLSVALLSVATRFTQVQQVSSRLYSEFVTDMSWTNCHHVNTKFSDNYCYLFKLFLSVNHANQILLMYRDVKFASSKHYSCLFFRMHEGNNNIIMFISAGIIYRAIAIHQDSAMFNI